MNKQTRTYEEIITLQDKAIDALTQANAALVMALETLKKARAEHGFPVQLPGLGSFGHGINIGNSAPHVPFVSPTSAPYVEDGVWNNGGFTSLIPMSSGGSASSAGSAGSAGKAMTNSLIAKAVSQKQIAEAYVNALQGWQAKKVSCF